LKRERSFFLCRSRPCTSIARPPHHPAVARRHPQPATRRTLLMAFSAHSIAQYSDRKPWFVVGVWVAMLVVSLGLIGAFLGTATTTTADMASNPDSKQGKELLEDRLRGPEEA